MYSPVKLDILHNVHKIHIIKMYIPKVNDHI